MNRLPRLRGQLFERHEITVEKDIVRARQAVGRAMDGLGAKAIRKTRLVTAASEIFRNGLNYGGGAVALIHCDAGNRMVWVDCIDDGPGIEDMALALRDGYTSGTGLGRGLGGAKRLVDEFDIVSEPGVGTHVRLAGRA
ncbi:ATP-binding protein [Palleronia abyssalis]|uniref:Serine/threonine-protein kinase RsbT n=1 Tax=Palleronia abyssalis TaxID=1501240 RepID=A0A2R8C0Z2_9RHOB|nr:ATP-binding protein [Palleronia abyssalis]SPJ26070.1 Serine/threonine-protein kinase RsbT [Palleronia abyssalis]